MDNLYYFEIGQKFKDFMLILIICVILSFLLSFFLTKEKKKFDKENYYDFQKENNSNNYNINVNQQNPNIKEDINDNNDIIHN